MATKQEILDLYDSDEIKSLLSELIDAEETISKEEPNIGFHHKFYVPGMIGAIQESIVEGKMYKFEKQPFYQDKNYIEFADWLIDSSRQLANFQIEAQKNDENNDVEKKDLQCKTIILVLQSVADAWYNRAPEVASWVNKEFYDEFTKISQAGLIFHHYELYLEPLGYPQHEETKPKVQEPDMGCYQFIGYVLNLLIIGLILWIGSLIFG